MLAKTIQRILGTLTEAHREELFETLAEPLEKSMLLASAHDFWGQIDKDVGIELFESIRLDGQKEPIVARLDGDGRLFVEDGHKRIIVLHALGRPIWYRR